MTLGGENALVPAIEPGIVHQAWGEPHRIFSYPTFARCCPTGVNDVAIQDVEEDVRQAEIFSFMSEADAGNEKTNS